MDDEELPYPAKLPLPLRLFSCDLTTEDCAVIRRIRNRWSMILDRVHKRDVAIMYARTRCTGVPPALKNLAVFLRYA